MAKRYFRLILAIVMIVNLFLPFHPPYGNQRVSTIMFIVFGFLSVIQAAFGCIASDISCLDHYTLNAYISFLSLPGVLLLILVGLSMPYRRQEVYHYRILVFIIAPLTWCRMIMTYDEQWPGVGFLVTGIVVSVAAISELFFLVAERRKAR